MIVLGLPSQAAAQPAHLVKDIGTELSPAVPYPSNAGWMIDLGGVVYFAADDGIHGQELWRTDGTTGGTYLVKDVCPGLCSSMSFSEIRASGGRLFFVADDGAHGRELWASDGSPAGTSLVVDGVPGLTGSLPSWLTDVQGTLYFKARDPAQLQTGGEQIYRVDTGTLAVTAVTTASATSEYELAALGSGLFFVACDTGHGCEPWFSDGTPASTVSLGDLDPGPEGALGYLQTPMQDPFFRSAASLGDRVVFTVTQGPTPGVWSTDGTPDGTQRISSNAPSNLALVGARVFFGCEGSSLNSGVCTSDGTVAGTHLVQDLSIAGAEPIPVASAGDTFYFSLDDFAGLSHQLWESDGTAGGTQMLKDFGSGTIAHSSYFFGGTVSDGTLYFFADDGVTGLEPWLTDGTPTGTRLLADLVPGSSGAVAAWFGSRFAAVGGRVVFFADTPTTGWQPFSTDGTVAGTALLRAVNAETSSLYLAFDLTPGFFGLARYPVLGGDGRGNSLLVTWTGNAGAEPWFTDGTGAGTHLVRDLQPGPATGATAEPPAFASFGGRFVFRALDASFASQIGLTDGTDAGTDLIPLPADSWGPIGMVPCAGRVFFDANSFWQSDGTVTGTHVVTPRQLDAAGCIDDRIVALVGIGADLDLETTDGTAGGTTVVHTWGNGRALASSLVATASRWFFGIADGDGMELWSSDGTDAGTQMAADINPGPADSIPNPWLLRFPGLPQLTPIVATRTHAFVIADDGAHGQELWVSDGTAAGTSLLRDIYPGARGSEPRQLVAARDRVYFVADDSVHGRELWTSDGTTAGTVLVTDLLAGPDSSTPWDLRIIDDTLVFGATDGVAGMELWVSHGSAASTRRLQDLAPGPESSTPMGFTRSGDRVYFYADDGVHGFEPWSFPVAVLGDDFFTLAPCRVFDSRSTSSLTGGLSTVVPLVGRCGIPSTARAVVFTATVVSPAAGGDLALYRAGDPVPIGSAVSFRAGRTRAGFTILGVDPDGIVALPRLDGSGTLDLVLDVSGYFE